MLGASLAAPEIFEVFTDNRSESDALSALNGGSGGIGMGIAKAFLNSSTKVIIAGTNQYKQNHCLSILKIMRKGEVRKILLSISNGDTHISPG